MKGEFMEHKNYKASLREKIQNQLQGFGQVDDDKLYELIDEEILELSRQIFLPLPSQLNLQSSIYDSFRRLDILQELLDDQQVTEIMVNGISDVFIERSGRIQRWECKFEKREDLEHMIQQIVSRVNRRVNTFQPIVDARLEDGSRVHVVLAPIALDGPILTIRKFPEAITIKKLIEYGSMDVSVADFLEQLVIAGYNIFISGGTGCGKTTFLNALSSYIPSEERVITIEDSAELQINQIPNLVRLETRSPNMEGEGGVSISDLIRASLRMRPDRIIVGEVRGKECLDMLQALNTGHSGSLSTGHANSPKDMLSRLETMTLMAAELPLAAIRSQIASAIDILIHLGRLRDNSRRVLEIVEVGGYVNGEIQLYPLYQFEEERGQPKQQEEKIKGSLRKTGELKEKQKLRAAGYSI